jgi:hypothetical protein
MIAQVSRHSNSLSTSTLLIAFCLFYLGCGGGDGGGGVIPPAVTAQFSSSGTAPAADLVYLRGGSVAGEFITLEVVISGPTTSQDLYSFAFDLLLSDPSVARFEPGTAAAGPVLQVAGGQDRSVLVSQQGDRVVVGVTKTGGGTGNGVGVGESVVLSLVFQVLKVGTTEIRFAGSPANPQNPSADPVAIDSNGATVTSVDFDGGIAEISGV